MEESIQTNSQQTAAWKRFGFLQAIDGKIRIVEDWLNLISVFIIMFLMFFATAEIIGRLGGYSVGIVANQSRFLAGALTVDASDKEARFIRFCDAFNIPLIFLADTTGFMPGSRQEHAGILRHGAKVLYAIAESVVPKIAVLIRKAYGGAKPAMGIDKRHRNRSCICVAHRGIGCHGCGSRGVCDLWKRNKSGPGSVINAGGKNQRTESRRQSLSHGTRRSGG